MKFPRRTLEDPAINLTPLIDVVFLLLIFFMVTTTFTRESRLVVDLPEADAELAAQTSEPVEIVVSQSGRYSIDGRVLPDNQVTTLQRELLAAAAGEVNVPVLLVADAAATHQAVVTAMDAIGQAGFSRLSIATRQPQGSDEGNDQSGAADGD